MEYLFPDLNIPKKGIKKFKKPTNREIQQWLKETEGVWSNDILVWLNKPTIIGRENKYTGSLTIAQQWWIICELQD